MREIRFRGRDIDTGEFVYGYYVPICPMSSNPGIVDDDEFVHEVKPESIAQFVGYDKDGREVYEGDILVDWGGTEWKGILNHVLIPPQFNSNEPFRTWFKLKEAEPDD